MVAGYRELGDALFERFNAPKSEQLWYYRSIVNTLAARDLPPKVKALVKALIDELHRTVGLLESLAGQSAVRST